MTLVFRYAFFALCATLTNLLSQALVLHFYQGPIDLWAAIFMGTGVGLATKYYLDKKWIFAYKEKGLLDDAKKFTLYTAMGIITTCIFWGTEWAFHHLWSDEMAKYFGATIGLSIGYLIKYQLDKRFVFNTST